MRSSFVTNCDQRAFTSLYVFTVTKEESPRKAAEALNLLRRQYPATEYLGIARCQYWLAEYFNDTAKSHADDLWKENYFFFI